MSVVLTIVNAWRPSLSHLQEVEEFGTNPGGLRMLTYLPDDLPASSALVVVLHGSTQSAANYDVGAGWSTLADRHGFALLMPEQTRKNNLNGSFSWFQRNDTQCGKGEAHSIVQMVEQIVRDHDIDRNRIFVTGLSAGGAMTLAMLASYPDVFAAGAVIAGLPYGGATNYLGRPASAYGVRTMSPGCRSTQMPLYFFNVQNGIVHHFDEAVIHHFQYQK